MTCLTVGRPLTKSGRAQYSQRGERMPTIAAADVATRLLTVQTNNDIEAILAAVPKPVWKPLGNKPNNHALINVLIDPADALVERVTNGLDAVIERKVLLENREDLQSPRQAAEELFGVTGGHVYNLRDDGERRALAAKVVVTLRDSGLDKAPTVAVEDRGVGQHPSDFETTLVSLAEENKLKRLYLMGAYGWGGAAAYAFTGGYATFLSRRDPALLASGQADEVGWTVVRYNARDDDPTVKHGVYEYLCVDEGGAAPTIPHFPVAALPTERQDWVGTLCTLVQYELARYSDAIWRPRNSLWLMFNALLFDPILPFLIRDERPRAVGGNEKSSLGGLVVNGTAAKLARDAEKKKDEKKLIALSGGYTYRLPDVGGQALISYFVVEEKGDAKADWEPTLTYVTPEQAVTVTHYGQRQGSFRRELFEKLGLMTLAKFLIVQVDCDALSWRAKRELFSSTRDRLKDSPLARTLREAVAEALQSDTVLRELDRRRKEAALARKSQAQAERIKKLLEKHIASLRQGQAAIFKKVLSSNTELPILGDQPLLDEAPPSRPEDGPETAQVEYEGDPTTLTVLNPTAQVRAGGKAVVRLALDAPDDYITAAGTGKGKFTPLVTKGSDLFRVVGNSDLRGGVMRCTISADNARPGDRGRIVFTVSRPDALPLLAEAEVVAIEPPQPRVKPAGKATGPEQGPNVFPVTKDEWGLFDFDEKTVARVEENSPKPGMTTVYVNQDYPPLVARLMAEKKTVGDKMEAYRDKFIAAMALHAWLQSEQQDPDQVVPWEVRAAELRRSAEMFLFAQFVD